MTAPTPADVAAVEALLGRAPEGDFCIVVRRPTGAPVVLENAPFLRDGRPMPTRFWLVDAELRTLVSRIEAGGGVDAAEAAVDPAVLAAHHRSVEAQRAAVLGPDDGRPRPTGGVAGTRVGVKCLHAHLAQYLVDGVDPVGAWVCEELRGHDVDLEAEGFTRG